MEKTFSEHIPLEDSLQVIQHNRLINTQKNEEFDDQVESLVCYPFQRPEVLKQGIHWLDTQFKQQQNKVRERDAAEVIAHHAIDLFLEDPQRTDFILEGPHHEIKVRIFLFSDLKKSIA